MMQIIPLAFDSLGTRSMATYVETEDVKILIDPGVSLGPSRYGLPPHPREVQRMNEHWIHIKEKAAESDVLVVTHYHYDHHNPSEPELYRNKTALLKHPTENINYSQKSRAEFFLKQLKDIPKKVGYCDGRDFKFNETTVKFSNAVSHGPGKRLGYVTEVSVAYGEDCFVHTSDIEGPCTDEQTEFILKENPNIIFIDGPLSYMLGYRYPQESLNQSNANLIKIMEETRAEKIILDHHLLRDIEWKRRISPAFKAAEDREVKVLTAAGFLNTEDDTLEARRRELFKCQGLI